MFTTIDRWSLIDADDNEFSIYDYTMKLLSEDAQMEVNIVERSFRAGADFPGQKSLPRLPAVNPVRPATCPAQAVASQPFGTPLSLQGGNRSMLL